ncbi:MAG TPA: pilus assembly protein PilC [Phycisphaerales bacterium]|nr:pilus assembly protein PilC [Phycisphaerales bacterium]
MPLFQYIARAADGQEVAGTLDAESEEAVVRSLDERKLYPVRVTEQSPLRRAMRGGRVRLRDLSVAYGQLADLLRAGVPLLRALETLVRAATNAALAKAIAQVRDEVAAGKTFTDALSDQPRTFNPLHAAMVRAGERAGFLEDVLANLAEFLERQDELRAKIHGAMIYPVVLAVMGIAVTTGILVGVVPRFRTFFAGITLPAPTAMLFALSAALTEHLALLLVILAAVIGAVTAFFRSPTGRRAWGRWQLRVPLMGKVIRLLGITRFCRILGTMLHNGVPILQALAISKDAAGVGPLTDAIEQAAENVKAGDTLAEPLNRSGLFPAEIVEMIAVAEESNQLEKVLVQVADTIERRTNRQVDTAVRLIEPLILVLMAVTIGFVAVGLLYPIFTMAGLMKR